MTSRRNFLKKSALATAGTLLVPNFLKAYERAHAGADPLTNRILVVIQLSGGNDGLNTIVPYRNDVYYRERPTLALPKGKILPISDELGFHPALAPLRDCFDDGLMTILNNVGYPNPQRSHLRSMDIWHSGSDFTSSVPTGWIGRYLDVHCPDNCPAPYQALEIGDTLHRALKGEKRQGLALSDPETFHQHIHSGCVEEIQKLALSSEGSTQGQVAYLYGTLAETVSSADYLLEQSKKQPLNTTGVVKPGVSYPDTALGKRLKTVSQLILSGAGTTVYYLSAAGFDTHVNQPDRQNRLLQGYAEAVAAFTQEMKIHNRIDDVLVMTFSEFGRQVKQNSQNGTDHGTINNVFLLGGRLQKGRIYNEAPDLESDPAYSIDFRSIYATLLRKWLKTDDVGVLGASFNTLDFLL